ncbi:MAG: enoyl-CoA hydratase/isomerase family protein [Hyphomicrobiaceae bacterium]|nr:enoyl-CoA hydratase/isomerase family protein [Hyphomicrobiaceae bacterium]
MAKVEWAVEGAVRHVLLNRPEKRNALDFEMMAELEAAFTAPAAANERVAVIRAAGTVFCAGLDLKERGSRPTGASPIESMLHAIESYPLPVVALVEGDAIAGGCELALHADIVVATLSARFAMPLAQLGMSPSWFLAKKLLETAGPVVTRQILLLGDPVTAERLHDLGVIGFCAEAGEFARLSESVIARLAGNAPLSLRAMKALVSRGMAFRDGIAHADVDAMVEAARSSRDCQEGIKARLEKRRPNFTGI